jgi:spore coat protein U-like protein
MRPEARRIIRCLAIVGALVLGLMPRMAQAACSVFTDGGLNFGQYDPMSPVALDSAATIRLECTEGHLYVRIDLSTGGSGTYAQRTMTNPADPTPLVYNLYQDANRTQVWGDGSGGTSSQVLWLTAGKVLTVYGRVFPQQDVAVGSFNDTVPVVITVFL